MGSQAFWTHTQIGALGKVMTGRTPPSSGDGFYGDDLLFVTPTDMDGRRIIDKTQRGLSDKGAELLSRIVCARGVIVSCIGWQMGKAAIVDIPFATNQQINTVIPDETKVDSRYLYYALSARREEIFNLGAGGSRTPILNKSSFERLPIKLPPLDNQRAIAHILGTLDDKIELNRRMNETLEEIARTLFTAWFVTFDPVRANTEGRQPEGMDAETAALFPDSFVASELGEIPAGWDVGRLDEVVVLQRGFDLPTPKRVPGPYPVVAASGYSGTHDQYMVTGPGVTTGRSGVLGKVFYVPENFWPLNTSLWVKEFVHSRPLYAYFLLSTMDFGRFNAGSAVPTLNRNHIHNAQVIKPPLAAIDAFERLAQPLFRKKYLNISESETLASIRDALLPELLSGELRVQEVEELVTAEAAL